MSSIRKTGISNKKKTFRPLVRNDLEPFQYSDQNKNIYISLKDPLSLSDRSVLIPPDLYYLVQFFDGKNSLADLREKFRLQNNRTLLLARLAKMIKMLDKAFLLDNTRSRQKREALRREFSAQKLRQQACAGDSYAESADEVRAMLQELFERSQKESAVREKLRDRSVTAMVAPHIDIRLGGPAYAAAYSALSEATPADTYVILGISHQPTTNLFALTDKDFQTPLGTVPTNKAFVADLLEKSKVNLLTDELVHRDEHSIEFQTLFLKYAIKKQFSIVPILASFSHLRSLEEEQLLADFIRALAETRSEYSGSICFIASVDFAHVGKLYGDSDEPNPYLLSHIERFDYNVLEAVAQKNVSEFEKIFANSNNKYHVCGYPALRTLIETIPKSNSLLVRYDNAIMDDHRSTVTYASMILY